RYAGGLATWFTAALGVFVGVGFAGDSGVTRGSRRSREVATTPPRELPCALPDDPAASALRLGLDGDHRAGGRVGAGRRLPATAAGPLSLRRRSQLPGFRSAIGGAGRPCRVPDVLRTVEESHPAAD